ncbi:unnamed protein product [Adineta steineri]|uniref:Uncharacterized protein n=1 Tax=Adineta steineri TaxID=433720 RepID=A0A814RKF2_9BILA|nr:unnamed protein product [Adineta steineri]CAF3973158.1 unnamed protein product [Adineta steineri]
MDREYCDLVDDLIVYRGQGLTRPELHYLRNKTGQLLTLSSFTSTTIDRTMALGYAQVASSDSRSSVLFEFHLHPTIDNTRPYAYVAEFSAIPDEYEVLLTYGIIFRLHDVSYNCETNVWIIICHLSRQQNHDIKNFSRGSHESQLSPSTFGADLCKYHKEQGDTSANLSDSMTLSNATTEICLVDAPEFVWSDNRPCPPIFDGFNGDDEDEGVHPILSMCIRLTMQQFTNNKTNIAIKVFPMKEEVDTVRKNLEYFFKLYEGRWRKPSPLVGNVESSMVSQNINFQCSNIPASLRDVLLRNL